MLFLLSHTDRNTGSHYACTESLVASRDARCTYAQGKANTSPPSTRRRPVQSRNDAPLRLQTSSLNTSHTHTPPPQIPRVPPLSRLSSRGPHLEPRLIYSKSVLWFHSPPVAPVCCETHSPAFPDFCPLSHAPLVRFVFALLSEMQPCAFLVPLDDHHHHHCHCCHPLLDACSRKHAARRFRSRYNQEKPPVRALCVSFGFQLACYAGFNTLNNSIGSRQWQPW